MNNFINLKCPSCGMPAEWLWRGTGTAVRYVTVKCPIEHHSIRKTYHVGNKEIVRDQLVEQWERLSK